jgi:Glutathione S-transferase, C-terminal domain
MDAVQDVYALIAPTNREPSHERKLAMRRALAAGPLPRWLGYFEAKLATNGTGYFVGDQVCVCEREVHAAVPLNITAPLPSTAVGRR